MKNIALAAVLLALASCSKPTAAPAVHPEIPAALVADPEHYTLELENEDVRVLRIKYAAHSKGKMHNHPHSVTVFLTPGNLRMTLPDGTSRDAEVPAGKAVFEEAGPHQPENIGDTDFEAVRIELKK